MEDTFEGMEEDDMEEAAQEEVDKILFEVTKGNEQPKIWLCCTYMYIVHKVLGQNMLYSVFNNYPPKWRWLAVDIYRGTERQGKYPMLVTDTEEDNCFSICPISE